MVEIGALGPDLQRFGGGRSRGGGAERGREGALGGVAGEEQGLGAGEARELQREEADHAAADDDDALAGPGRADVDAVERAGQGLAEGAVVGVEVGRQDDGLVGREGGELGEAAVAVDAGGDVVLAEIDAAAEAGVAMAAPGVGVAGDAGAFGQGDAGAAGGDDAGELVAERHRRGGGELALEEVAVGAADAGGLDADHDLAGGGSGTDPRRCGCRRWR